MLSNTCIDRVGVQALAEATDHCWQAIVDQDAVAFGDAVRRFFEAQVAMFPNMVTPTVRDLIAMVRGQALGWKLSGAGGGGYLILVAESPLENGIRCYTRRMLG